MSFCFPFDFQKCEMKFGSWTYGGEEVDLKHLDADKESVEFERDELNPTKGEKVWKVEEGADDVDRHRQTID